MRKILRLRMVVSLGKAGVELGSQVRLPTLYPLTAVKWSLVFTTGLHNSDTLYIYALVHAANISIFPSLMGDGGHPELPGPLTGPGSFPHAAPLLEEGGGPRAQPAPLTCGPHGGPGHLEGAAPRAEAVSTVTAVPLRMRAKVSLRSPPPSTGNNHTSGAVPKQGRTETRRDIPREG